MATRDWSELPLDLLGVIINRLPVSCCLRVRAVCRSWSLAVAETTYCPTNPQLPWLLATEGDSTTPNFYALSERRSYHLNIPAGSSRCIAYSHGWLLFVNQVAELHLLNPITGVRLPLPSITTFSDINGTMRNRKGRINYICLPPTPTSSPMVVNNVNMTLYYNKVKVISDRHFRNITVFVFHGFGMQRLSYATAGDETWTEIAERHCFKGMLDFAFHKGKLHGVFGDGRLVVIDNLTSPLQNLRYINPRLPDISMACNNLFRQKFYLVDSADGEDLLLVIRRVINDVSSFNLTSSFLVLKLDSESEWKFVQRLEETAIFLGENRSMALYTHHLPELKENCIYFTDITNCRLSDENEEGIFHGDEGIFHLEDQSISPLLYDLSSSHPRQWFTPAL